MICFIYILYVYVYCIYVMYKLYKIKKKVISININHVSNCFKYFKINCIQYE